MFLSRKIDIKRILVTVLYQFFETGTSDRFLICIVQNLHFSFTVPLNSKKVFKKVYEKKQNNNDLYFSRFKLIF